VYAGAALIRVTLPAKRADARAVALILDTSAARVHDPCRMADTAYEVVVAFLPANSAWPRELRSGCEDMRRLSSP
jgi:hypothetical protein